MWHALHMIDGVQEGGIHSQNDISVLVIIQATGILSAIALCSHVQMSLGLCWPCTIAMAGT